MKKVLCIALALVLALGALAVAQAEGEKLTFADLDVEPLVFHSHFTSGRRYVGLVAVEHGDDLFVTPYCDNRLYSREFVLGLGRCINKYVDRILASEDPTVADLFKE